MLVMMAKSTRNMNVFLSLFETKTPIPSVGDFFECISDAIMDGAPCTGKIIKVTGGKITLTRSDQDETKVVNLDDCGFAQTDGGWLIDLHT